MKTLEAIKTLEDMDAQLIHAKRRVFKEIADAFRAEVSRRAKWQDFACHQEHCATCGEAVSDCFEGARYKAIALEADALQDAPAESANVVHEPTRPAARANSNLNENP